MDDAWPMDFPTAARLFEPAGLGFGPWPRDLRGWLLRYSLTGF